jgi:hypothetical protein
MAGSASPGRTSLRCSLLIAKHCGLAIGRHKLHDLFGVETFDAAYRRPVEGHVIRQGRDAEEGLDSGHAVQGTIGVHLSGDLGSLDLHVSRLRRKLLVEHHVQVLDDIEVNYRPVAQGRVPPVGSQVTSVLMIN